MASFSRSSFIPKSIVLSSECRNDPVVWQLKDINNNMRKIDAYVVLGLKGKRKQIEDQRKRDNNKDRQDKKLGMERQKKVNPIEFIKDKLPRTGFLDAIKNFILYTFMGMAAPYVLKNLPKILGVVKFIVPFVKGFEDFAGNLLGGIVSAIDFGYKVHDKVRSILKSVTGDNIKLEKSFDELEKNLGNFLNLAIIAGLAIAGSGALPGPKIGKGRGPTAPPKLPKTLSNGSLSRVNDSYARFIAGEANIGDRARLVKRGFINVGEAATKGGTDVLAKRAAAQTGGKFVGKFAKVFGRVPVVGGLIDFAISMLMGEPVGRAAAKAVGSSVGFALGSFIPVPLVGSLLGGLLGDVVGGALYDTLEAFGKPKKHASGGRIGGRSASRTPRTIRTVKTKRPPKQIRQRTMPGKNVGGEENIKKIFPDSDDAGTMSQLRLLKKNSSVMKKAGVFGNLLSSGLEMMALGQKIERPTLNSLEKYLAYVIQSSIDDQTTANAKMLGASMFAMASGGMVPVGRTLQRNGATTGQVVAKEIVRSFTAMLDNRSSEIFQNIRREMELKAPMGTTETGPGTPGTGVGDDSNAGVVFNALMAAGFSFNQAAGIVGNLMQESTANLDPNADNGGHHGIAQWSKDARWPQIVKYVNSIGKDPNTIEGQAAGLVWELTKHPDYKQAHADLLKAKTPEEAAAIFLEKFEKSGEKPGQEGYDNRLKNARQIAQRFSSNVGANIAGLVAMVETSQFNTPRRGHLHQGIDIASGEGNSAHLPVVVKVGGRVDYAGIASDGNGMVIINHPNGDVTRYLHLNNFRVRVGQNISAGTIIGRIAGPGESGYGTSDGAHLHFEYKPKGGYAVNPKQIWRNYVIIGGTVASTPTSNQSNSSSSSLTSPIKPNSRVGSRQPFNPASLSPVTPGGTTVVTLSSFSVYEDGKKVVYSRKRVNNSDVYTKNGKPISEDEYWKASNKKNNISSNQVDGKGTQLTVASSPQQQRLQQISNIATRMRTDIIKETQILIQPINT